MKVYTTTTWDFRTYSIKATCKCSKCGKSISKTFSFQTREDSSPQKEDWDELERRKNEWLKEKHVCNSCKKKKVNQERKEDITEKFTTIFDDLNQLQRDITDIKILKKNIIEKLGEQLDNKVIVYNNKEYVVKYVQDGIYEDCAFEIACNPISQTKPWMEATGKTLFFYKRTYKQCGWDNFIEVENCIITNEVFETRRQVLREL